MEYTPAQQNSLNLRFLRCGAESEPKKNFELPERAAFNNDFWWFTLLITGLQNISGLKKFPRKVFVFSSKWCVVIVAAMFLCDFTKSTEFLVVICSKVIFKPLKFFTNQDNSKSRNLFSRS